MKIRFDVIVFSEEDNRITVQDDVGFNFVVLLPG